ncbi:hypothetical protein EYZ11_013143 [Aspergillus tanneri]|uniref:Major facilitator superfamily (MFS) profile domain-containing protein n=1 Tax=Aspergillus tanneri TaxID=1220188 RepID=A0A4S3IYX3_9EURO|nr:uncharacterized protein ATNIH1004_010654 [Aspergillus tanneri]KAA8641715.1 hypothetical protein ATNIH1004_010654 [Aspergillus tanneri]THC87412.1 hypothetical protein EYZ11_013143 [Aspergillus tanneri]
MGSQHTSHQAASQRASTGGDHLVFTWSSRASTTRSQSNHRETRSSSRALLSDGLSTETREYSTFAESSSSHRSSDTNSDSASITDTRLDSDSSNSASPHNDTAPAEMVGWASMPKKGQLAILTFARLSEPLTQTSLQAYLFYQLQSYDTSLPASTISTQAGVMQGSFTAAQFLTAMWWGSFADMEIMGRKRVMLIGLAGTCISCIGFAFSKSFTAAVLFRIAGGVLNSNVGVLRTMIAEIVSDKKYQSLAFLILPMCFNVGVIIGPILGGSMADPIKTYPGLFGPGSKFGGREGVSWMKEWPFALPNLVNALIVFMAMVAVLFGLEETHELAQYRSDWGLKAGRTLKRVMTGCSLRKDYQPLNNHQADDEPLFSGDVNGNMGSADESQARAKQRKRPGFRHVWTRNLILILAINFLLAFHASAFNSMTFTFLSIPRTPLSEQGWFHFGGGLGLESSQVGLATTIIGVIGLPLQIFVYPYVQSWLGTLKAFRVFLPFSPLAYALLPFAVILPRVAYLIWPYFTIMVFLQVVSRTFALPAGIILINNCVSSPLVLGTVHGVAQSITCAARTLGPIVGGWGLALGLKYNIVGGVWWGLAAEALLGWVLLWTVYEGNGIEQDETDEE